MPPWNHLHPLIVHFPIALLLVTPLVVALGLLWPAQRPGIFATALGLLGLGTGMAVLALATGLAVADTAPRDALLLAELSLHEASGKQTTLCYLCLLAAYLTLWFLSKPTRPLRLMFVLWLVASLGASLSLARTGHLGGRLVHELGFHARRLTLP